MTNDLIKVDGDSDYVEVSFVIEGEFIVYQNKDNAPGQAYPQKIKLTTIVQEFFKDLNRSRRASRGKGYWKMRGVKATMRNKMIVFQTTADMIIEELDLKRRLRIALVPPLDWFLPKITEVVPARLYTIEELDTGQFYDRSEYRTYNEKKGKVTIATHNRWLQYTFKIIKLSPQALAFLEQKYEPDSPWHIFALCAKETARTKENGSTFDDYLARRAKKLLTEDNEQKMRDDNIIE